MEYELNGFYNADCMEAMKTFPDKYFELAIVDPPYGIGESGSKNNTRSKLAKSKNYKAFHGNDISAPEKEYFDELYRVSNKCIIWGGNYFVEYLKPARCFIVWDKKTGDNSYADCELALTNIDGNARLFSKLWLGANYLS